MTSSLRRGAVLGALAAIAIPTAALGHASVAKRYPAAGASLASGPKTVYVTFTQQIRSGSTLTVRRGGRVVLRGRNDPRNVKRVIGKSSRRLARGSYRVSWSASYPDGHKENGTWSFRVR